MATNKKSDASGMAVVCGGMGIAIISIMWLFLSFVKNDYSISDKGVRFLIAVTALAAAAGYIATKWSEMK